MHLMASTSEYSLGEEGQYLSRPKKIILLLNLFLLLQIMDDMLF